MICFADYHTHTYYSHGKGSVRDNVEAAARKGLEEIAISDHGPNHLSLFGIKDLTVLSRIREDLKAACAEFPQVKGLVSIEANIISTDGDLDLPPERAHLVDLVQAGLHASVRLASARAFWQDSWVALSGQAVGAVVQKVPVLQHRGCGECGV